MRTLTTKYEGACAKCGATIPEGAQAVYERGCGIYCPVGCAPTDPEEIRDLRTAAAERKALRLDGWAAKREEKASAVLDVDRNHYSRDWAFVTQPGHIPARARWIKKQEREFENVREAQRMRAKANSLRSGVRVAGDREAEREREREAVRSWIAKGQRVRTVHYGTGTVERVCQKSIRLRCDGFGGVVNVPIHHVCEAVPSV